MTEGTIRKPGVWSSIAAAAAFGLAVTAGNRKLGFGYYIARHDQVCLFAVAMTLCALQAVVYLMTRGKGGDATRGQHDKRS